MSSNLPQYLWYLLPITKIPSATLQHALSKFIDYLFTLILNYKLFFDCVREMTWKKIEAHLNLAARYQFAHKFYQIGFLVSKLKFNKILTIDYTTLNFTTLLSLTITK